jgi:NDP-sugar pyrophosphorylase family protein
MNSGVKIQGTFRVALSAAESYRTAYRDKSDDSLPSFLPSGRLETEPEAGNARSPVTDGGLSLKAMILAAGLGTRLRPLTDVRPKPLVPVLNRPVLERTITYLKSQGITRVVVNAHHHAQRLIAYLQGGRAFEIPVEVRFEPRILGTGGGIRNVSDFWGEDPLLVVNGDIVTAIGLSPAFRFHRESGAEATLLLHDHPAFRQILVDEVGQVRDIASKPRPGRLAFTGIHILEPGMRRWIPETGFSNIITSYREMIEKGEPPAGYVTQGEYWRDIGTIESYLLANQEASEGAVHVGENCSVDPSAHLEDWCVIGAGSRVGPGASIARSVLWEEVTVEKGVRIEDSVVTAGRTVARDLLGGAW